MTFYKWSKTAANNATADSTCPFPEGMAASALNDGARGLMAAAAKYRDDVSGATVTAGTSTALTLSTNEVFGTLLNLAGQMVAFTPHATNGATVTLNVDGLGAKPLRSAPGVELLAGTLILGTPYVAVYNNADGVFYLQGYFSSPYNIPFLGGLDYWGSVAPNSAFIFPAGQAISRTVYAAAWAAWGTTFGVGDGATTFNVPDKRGRVSAMIEAAASRLTAAGFGGNSAVIGAVGGAEKQALATANLPAYTPAGSIVSTPTPVGLQGAAFIGANITGGGVPVLQPTGGSTNTVGPLVTIASAFTGTPQGGTSSPVPTTQPTIVCNYIIRIL